MPENFRGVSTLNEGIDSENVDLNGSSFTAPTPLPDILVLSMIGGGGNFGGTNKPPFFG